MYGFIGSGKDTVAEILKNEFSFLQKDSFAAPLKDSASQIFNWNREMLEGSTKESREWREQPDLFWSEQLGYEVTPRKMLQRIGTEVFRENLHKDIWVLSLLRRAQQRSKTTTTIVTDCRFPNEINAIRNNNGLVIRVKRGEEPTWFEDAKIAMTYKEVYANIALDKLKKQGIHPSEFSWVGSEFDFEINNDGDLNDLKNSVFEFISSVNLFNYLGK